jgi:hypothetical protein
LCVRVRVRVRVHRGLSLFFSQSFLPSFLPFFRQIQNLKLTNHGSPATRPNGEKPSARGDISPYTCTTRREARATLARVRGTREGGERERESEEGKKKKAGGGKVGR